MVRENIDSATQKFSGDISAGQSKMLEDVLESAPDEKFDNLTRVKTKSVTLTTILSAVFGLFGAGSFYLGLFKRGICKIVFNVILPLKLGLVLLYWYVPLQREYARQSKSIYNAVQESIDIGYDYSFEKVKVSGTACSSAITTITNNAKILNAQNSLLDSYATGFSSGSAGEAGDGDVLETRYSAFVEKLSSFSGSSALTALSGEVEKSLAQLESLTSDDNTKNYDNFKAIPQTIAKIPAASQFLASFDVDGLIARYSQIIPELSPYIGSFTASALTTSALKTNFDNFKSAFDKFCTDYDNAHKQFAENMDIARNCYGNVSSLISNLNDEIFNLRKTAGTTLEKEAAADSSLYKALQTANEANTALFNALLEEELNWSTFYGNLSGALDLSSCISTISSVSYNTSYISGEEKTNISVLSGDKLVNIFVELKNTVNEVDSYYEFLSGDFYKDLEKSSDSYTEIKDREVLNRVQLSKFIDDVRAYCSAFAAEENITEMEKHFGGMINLLSDMSDNRADVAYWDYRFNYSFVNGYFTTLLAIDGVVIAVYWVFEVFREREKCRKYNYENLLRSIN